MQTKNKKTRFEPWETPLFNPADPEAYPFRTTL